jgi:hypothetical protein
MRKALLAALFGSALLIMAAAPALAESDAKLNVWCSIDKGSTLVDLQGTYWVDDNSTGPVVLTLWASPDGIAWQSTGKTVTIHKVMGETAYNFKFGGALDASVWMDFRVGGGLTQSRVVSRDECGVRVPEAPATALLLLGAFPAAGLIAIKVMGVRLPRPTLHRIG